MAVLQKMRDKFGVAISVIIALSLLYFIAPMDDLMTLFGRPQNVGEINGRGISYEDFIADVEKYTTISEVASGSTVQNEQTQQQARNMAWQALLDEYMFIRNAKEAGIRVGNAEAAQIIRENIPEEDLRALVESDNEQLRTYWRYIQNSVAWQQYHVKYNSLFVHSAVENPLTLASAVALGNTTVDFDVVEQMYSFAPDSTIKVSNSEIRSYYKANKQSYRQNASRDIEYVVFEVTPSAADRAATEDKMNQAYAEFKNAVNMKSFLMKNSDRSFSEYWYKASELNTVSSDVAKFVETAKNGQVSQIFVNGDSFYAAKVMDTKSLADSVYVKHILLQGADVEKADSILRVVKTRPGQFSTVAMMESADQGSQADGEIGNIGWMTQTYMIPGFESVISAKLNEPFVLDTQYGKHVVVVTKRTAPVVKKQVAVLEKSVAPSKETFNVKYAEANRFASMAAGTLEGYNKAVDSLGVYSHRMNSVQEGNSTYGSVDQAREITRWVFDAKAGKASNIITVNNNYFFVAALKAVHKEGFTPVKEVAPQIRQTLYAQKRSEKAAAAVAAKIEGLETLEEVAQALGAEVKHRSGVSLSNVGMGAEPALLGALAVAEQGKVSAPVAGVSGVSVVVVTNREVGSFYTETDARNRAQQMAQYKTQLIVPVMMEDADVKDNRARYY